MIAPSPWTSGIAALAPAHLIAPTPPGSLNLPAFDEPISYSSLIAL